MTKKHKWFACSRILPPESVIVETKVDDVKGIRNITKLKLYKNLWFFPDSSMHVYYKPTHWRYL